VQDVFVAVCAGLLISAAAAALLVVLRSTGRSVQLLTLGYLGFGVLATFAYHPSMAEETGQNRIPIAFYRSLSVWEVFSFFALPAACTCLGGALAALWLNKRGDPSRPVEGGPSIARTSIVLPAWTLWLTALSLALNVYGSGLQTILRTDTYLSHSGPVIAVIIGTALGPLGVLVAANVLLGGRASGPARVSAVALLAAAVLLSFGQATRMLSLCPLLVFAGGLVAGRWSRRRAVTWGIVATAAAVTLLGVPLYLRGQPELGLLPALETLFSRPGSFFGEATNPLSNLLLGVPLSLYVGLQAPEIPREALWVSVNPLPGGFTNWEELAPQLRFNAYEPFTGLGELANHGLVPLVVYMLVLGFVFEALENIALRPSPRVAGLLAGTIFGIAGIVLIRTTQYNLRTDTRLVYYAVALVMICWAIDRALGHRPDRVPALPRLRDSVEAT
jgi:hypothetical protein